MSSYLNIICFAFSHGHTLGKMSIPGTDICIYARLDRRVIGLLCQAINLLKLIVSKCERLCKGSCQFASQESGLAYLGVVCPCLEFAVAHEINR